MGRRLLEQLICHRNKESMDQMIVKQNETMGHDESAAERSHGKDAELVRANSTRMHPANCGSQRRETKENGVRERILTRCGIEGRTRLARQERTPETAFSTMAIVRVRGSVFVATPLLHL